MSNVIGRTNLARLTNTNTSCFYSIYFALAYSRMALPICRSVQFILRVLELLCRTVRFPPHSGSLLGSYTEVRVMQVSMWVAAGRGPCIPRRPSTGLRPCVICSPVISVITSHISLTFAVWALISLIFYQSLKSAVLSPNSWLWTSTSPSFICEFLLVHLISTW